MLPGRGREDGMGGEGCWKRAGRKRKEEAGKSIGIRWSKHTDSFMNEAKRKKKKFNALLRLALPPKIKNHSPQKRQEVYFNSNLSSHDFKNSINIYWVSLYYESLALI